MPLWKCCKIRKNLYKSKKAYIVFLLLQAFLLSSCIDETFVPNAKEGYIALAFNGKAATTPSDNETRAYEGEKPGEHPDNIIRTLRVLIFQANGSMADAEIRNKRYDILNSALEVIKHPIKEGSNYTLVFLANEPATQSAVLDNIGSFADLKALAFPANAFGDNIPIPMIQVIEEAELQAEGKIRLNKGTLFDINGRKRPSNPAQGLYPDNHETELLMLRLDRLAMRLNVELNSEFVIDEKEFDGITLSNIPDEVPLFAKSYTSNIGQTGQRSYPSTAFSNGTISGGKRWSKMLSRIVLPSNHLSDSTDADKGVLLTVNIQNKYNPDARLRIDADDYRLPYNTWLDFTGNVKKPLEVNIEAAGWENPWNEWQLEGNRILNVSHSEANITDFNGMRISFYSNMPVVKVLPTVTKNGTSMDTNLAFNELVTTENWRSADRFHYDPNTGHGYMDIIVDGGTAGAGDQRQPLTESGEGTYVITLSAENRDGDKVLQKKITIHVKQYGARIRYNFYDTRYIGAFFKDNEQGERIIQGQETIASMWRATTTTNWIVLSKTPSFDPGAGTDTPGDPEKYPVIPDGNGKDITGYGRVYFRIGTTGANPNPGTPRYGVVTIEGWSGPTHSIFVRQGETADYLFEPTNTIGTAPADEEFAPLAGRTRTRATKFAVYNLTANEFKVPSNAADFYTVTPRGGIFVDYPSQGGALFQWGVPLSTGKTEFYRRAYKPYGPTGKDPSSWWRDNDTDDKEKIMWDAATGYTEHKSTFETCPLGYRRPTDGPTNEIAYNGPYPVKNPAASSNTIVANEASFVQARKEQIADSEFRVSLFPYPYAGNANENADYPAFNPGGNYDGTYPQNEWARANAQYVTALGFYADGYFDRRPLTQSPDIANQYNVSANTGQVAYGGYIFFNGEKSIFFPAAGTLINYNGAFKDRGNTGRYWTSSVGPDYSNTSPFGFSYDAPWGGGVGVRHGAWGIEMAGKGHTLPKNVYLQFGHSIRCVKE